MDAILTNERVNAPQDQIIDVALPEIRKKKFRFNQDDNRIVELNVSDMNIVTQAQRFTGKGCKARRGCF